jgi:hypothetical protein
MSVRRLAPEQCEIAALRFPLRPHSRRDVRAGAKAPGFRFRAGIAAIASP